MQNGGEQQHLSVPYNIYTTETCECEERLLRQKLLKAVQRSATGTIKAAAINIDFCLSWLLGSDLCSALEHGSSEPAPPSSQSGLSTHLWTRSTMCAISLSEMPGQDSSAKLKAFSSSSMAPTLPPVCLCLSLSCNPETGH